MRDFLEADINELLYEKAEPVNEDEVSYKAMVDKDIATINGFIATPRESAMKWPEPVRKRHIR